MSGSACRCCLPALPGGRIEGSGGGMGDVPYLRLIGSLSRRVDRVPTLRDCLWKLEGAVLGRMRAATGAAGHA